MRYLRLPCLTAQEIYKMKDQNLCFVNAVKNPCILKAQIYRIVFSIYLLGMVQAQSFIKLKNIHQEKRQIDQLFLVPSSLLTMIITDFDRVMQFYYKDDFWFIFCACFFYYRDQTLYENLYRFQKPVYLTHYGVLS